MPGGEQPGPTGYFVPAPAPGVSPPQPPPPTPRPCQSGAVPGPVGMSTLADAAAPPSEQVPPELLGAAESGGLTSRLSHQWLTQEQIRFIVQYFLYAVDVLASRGMPRRNGMLLVAQTGLETSYGTKGPNPKHNNFLSFQPPEAQRDRLKSLGITIVIEDRVNKPGGPPQPTPVPHFRDIRQSLEVQLDVAYREIWPSLGSEMKKAKATAESYGTAADRAHYSGTPYMSGPTTLPAQYLRCLPLVKSALGNLPAGMSADTRAWAAKLVGELGH